MGLVPRTQPTGPKTTTADDDFRLIPLSNRPLFGEGLQSGIVFGGHSLDAVIDNSLSCCGKYTLRNTQHHSVAGLTSDGCLLFAVNCQIGGRCCTAMGGYDPMGEPIVPTLAQQTLLKTRLPNADNLMVWDAKPGSIGLKMNGANPNASVYFNALKKELNFHINASWADPDIKAHTSLTVDKDLKFAGGSLDVEAAVKGFKAIASTDFDNKLRATNSSLQLAATHRSLTATGSMKTAGKETTRQLDLSYQATKRVKITASWLPDNKPQPAPKVEFPFKPASFHDASKFRIELKIDLW